jgi:hypothetical protein
MRFTSQREFWVDSSALEYSLSSFCIARSGKSGNAWVICSLSTWRVFEPSNVAVLLEAVPQIDVRRLIEIV